jgi:hypothetical protein
MRLQWARLGQEGCGNGKRARQKKWDCKTEVSDCPLRRSQRSRMEVEPRRHDCRHNYGQENKADDLEETARHSGRMILLGL